METFDFPFHKVTTENPESGIRVQLGGSYTFTSPPTDPDQRTFILEFPLMKYFFDVDGEPDATVNPQYNMKALIDFYAAHKLWDSFLYEHPVHGTLEVKFQKPLIEPPPPDNAIGIAITKPVTVTLIEQP